MKAEGRATFSLLHVLYFAQHSEPFFDMKNNTWRSEEENE
jgi:hypothetical protein